jgi:hypothetical protein
MKAIAQQNTKLTKVLADSSTLEPYQIFEIAKGNEFELRAIAPQVTPNQKRMVTFNRGIGPKNYNTWFLYPAHWNIEGAPRKDYAEATEPKAATESSAKGGIITPIPRDQIDWNHDDCPISEFFCCGDVTHGERARIPSDSATIGRVIAMAIELDKIRKEWGSAIACTSWYRPVAINRAVGGASQSQHLTGGGVDIYAVNGNDYRFEDFLDAHWGGGLGYGVASGRHFTHLDLREGGWRRGPGTIRWTY